MKVLSTQLTDFERYFIKGIMDAGEELNLVTKADAKSIWTVDLLFLRGGVDIDPSRYKGDVTKCSTINTTLDAWEAHHINLALSADVPIFGICRGAQSLWVELGGRLKEEVHPEHQSTFIVGNKHKITGAWGDCLVNSLHHQMVRLPTPVLNDGEIEVTMHSQDGGIEAFIYKNNCVGVQWHPEWMPHQLWQTLLCATLDGWLNTVGELNYSLVDVLRLESPNG